MHELSSILTQQQHQEETFIHMYNKCLNMSKAVHVWHTVLLIYKIYLVT